DLAPSVTTAGQGFPPVEAGRFRSTVGWLAAVLQFAIHQSPGWLTSAAAHAGLIGALAWMTYAVEPGSVVHNLSVAIADEGDSGDDLLDMVPLEPSDSSVPETDASTSAGLPDAIQLSNTDALGTPTGIDDPTAGDMPGPGVLGSGDDVAAAIGRGIDVP